MNAYLDVLKKYATFGGRASRREFWMFSLFHAIIIVVLSVIGAAAGINWLVGVYVLATLIPSLALQIRRLHDLNKSGGWWFITFVPFGSIVLLVWACMAGTPGDNRFGPNPAGLAGTPAFA
jgi:uncharacterized membrane protein YhaH (DUF805 family)